MSWIHRLLGRQVQDPYDRLVSDIDRTRGPMRAVITDARRLDVPVPYGVVVAVTSWTEWLEHLTTPIEDDQA